MSIASALKKIFGSQEQITLTSARLYNLGEAFGLLAATGKYCGQPIQDAAGRIKRACAEIEGAPPLDGLTAGRIRSHAALELQKACSDAYHMLLQDEINPPNTIGGISRKTGEALAKIYLLWQNLVSSMPEADRLRIVSYYLAHMPLNRAASGAEMDETARKAYALSWVIDQMNLQDTNSQIRSRHLEEIANTLHGLHHDACTEEEKEKALDLLQVTILGATVEEGNHQ